MADLSLKHIFKEYSGGVTAVSDFVWILGTRNLSFWSGLQAV